MSIENIFFACSMVGMFISFISYLVFGQITVKKLRKNPNTKDALGIEFASGWDIYNVAQALSLPRALTRKLEGGPLSSMYAKSECLEKNTSVFDKILAFVFYWLFTLSGLTLIAIVALKGFDII